MKPSIFTGLEHFPFLNIALTPPAPRFTRRQTIISHLIVSEPSISANHLLRFLLSKLRVKDLPFCNMRVITPPLGKVYIKSWA